MKYEDYTFGHGPPHGGRIRTHEGESPKVGRYDWIEGPVVTPHGVVLTYSQGGEGFRPVTYAELPIGRRTYVRRWPRRYSKRYLVTLARRFAEEVAGDERKHLGRLAAELAHE